MSATRLRSLVALTVCEVVMIAPSRSSAADSDASQPVQVVANDTSSAATWVAPTLLVTPAGALPTYGARVTVGTDYASPRGSADSLRPVGAFEIGLGKGFTVGAGTQWIGGDVGTGTDGLSPYAQVRLQVFGSPDGEGWVGGAALRYKQVGFGGGEKETEASFATRYRRDRIEVGLEGVFGQSMKDAGEHDVEARAYGVIRPISFLALGLTGQARTSVGETDANSPPRTWDLTGGGIASAVFGTMQLGVMGGATTLNLASGVGATGQAFAAYRF
ncbi:MAG: hypothetical protein ACHREM_09470 [Polyangiales bacterium]